MNNTNTYIEPYNAHGTINTVTLIYASETNKRSYGNISKSFNECKAEEVILLCCFGVNLRSEQNALLYNARNNTKKACLFSFQLNSVIIAR